MNTAYYGVWPASAADASGGGNGRPVRIRGVERQGAREMTMPIKGVADVSRRR